MAISFIVEDGSRVASANSYVTLAEYKQYWENRGVDYSSLADATIQPLLIKATQYIEQLNFKGVSYTLTQALVWPRVYMMNSRGKAINTDEIPDELKNAVCELAKYIYTKGSLKVGLNNVRQKRIGPVSTSFFSDQGVEGYLSEAYEWLRPFLSNVNAVRV